MCWRPSLAIHQICKPRVLSFVGRTRTTSYLLMFIEIWRNHVHSHFDAAQPKLRVCVPLSLPPALPFSLVSFLCSGSLISCSLYSGYTIYFHHQKKERKKNWSGTKAYLAMYTKKKNYRSATFSSVLFRRTSKINSLGFILVPVKTG